MSSTSAEFSLPVSTPWGSMQTLKQLTPLLTKQMNKATKLRRQQSGQQTRKTERQVNNVKCKSAPCLGVNADAQTAESTFVKESNS